MFDMTAPDLPPDSPIARKANIGQTFRAVAWSFLGIRRSADHAQDVEKLNPIHVVIAAIIGAAVFVVLLVVLVHVVTSATSH
jgi:amino acid transporter